MKIIIASGGTLGHITPILPVVEVLKSEKNELILYTTKRQVVSDFYQNNDYFSVINYYETKGISKKIAKALKTNLVAYQKIKNDLDKAKPNLVIGMGGYISGIVIKAAHSLKIKTIIYEQNSILGKANKWSLKCADYFIYSYQELKIPRKVRKNNCCLINPRQEYARGLIPFYQKKANQILITSGSLGSEKINEVMLEVIKQLPDYHFIMITGERYYDLVKREKIANLTPIASTSNLIKHIIESKLVISRAGASTIAEIIGANTLGIYIPSPNVTANHQLKNTDFISKMELGIVILEQDLVVDNMVQKINYLLCKEASYQRRIDNYNQETSIFKFIKIIKETVA